MSTYYYRTSGTCSMAIEIKTEGDTIEGVRFQGGCNGNLNGISRLVKGQKLEDIANTLEGTTCGMKRTSCPDQLARALRGVIEAEAGGEMPESLVKAN